MINYRTLPSVQGSVPIIGPGWFVTRYDDVVTVAKDERFSRDIAPLVRWLLPLRELAALPGAIQ